MNPRQEQLLSLIVSEYTHTATPVGSKSLAENRELDVSSATIRNDMVELEAEGYIYQPHTSAGRVPTEKGYQYYIKHFIRPDGTAGKTQQQQLQKSVVDHEQYELESVKHIAKKLAELVDGAVFIGSGGTNVYYTGLSNLFGQPEFAQQNLVHQMSHAIDHLDQALIELIDEVDEQPRILVGNNSPFGKECGMVVIQYRVKNNVGMIGILGPIRMDYQRNVDVLKYTKELIDNLE